MQSCGTCDAENREGVRFCTSCGDQLVLELSEAALAEPELELQSPSALASACWRGGRGAAALETLRAILPLGTVEPFGVNREWDGFRSRLGSDAAALMSGVPIEARAPDRVVDMPLPGDGTPGPDALPTLWNKLRMADARASGRAPARPPLGIPAGPVEASHAVIAGWRAQFGARPAEEGR